jgi:hypothetical protein
MGIPALLAQYDPLTGQTYGTVLASDPRIQALTKIEDLEGHLVNQESNFNYDIVKEFRSKCGAIALLPG